MASISLADILETNVISKRRLKISNDTLVLNDHKDDVAQSHANFDASNLTVSYSLNHKHTSPEIPVTSVIVENVSTLKDFPSSNTYVEPPQSSIVSHRVHVNKMNISTNRTTSQAIKDTPSVEVSENTTPTNNRGSCKMNVIYI